MRLLDLGMSLEEIGSKPFRWSAIKYQNTSGEFIYRANADGTVILDNQGDLSTPNDGLIYSGRGLELLATNSVKFPIHHTLGTELLTTTITNGEWQPARGTVTDNGGESYTFIQNANGAGYIVLKRTSTLWTVSPAQGDTMHCEITIDSSSVNLSNILQYYALGGGINVAGQSYTSGSGSKTFKAEFTWDSSTSSYLNIGNGALIGDTFTFSSFSIKNLTNPNSYLTYYDLTLGEFVTLDMSVVA